MPADDLALAIRIRADVQQVLDEMRKLNDRLGDTHERGREATRSLRGLKRAAFEAGDAHGALAGQAQAAFAAMAEGAREADRDRAQAGESWIDRTRAELERLRRDSDDVAEETRDVTVGAFRSMEHAVARFATTGRLSFSGFVDSVIADLARLAARRAITRPLAALIAGALPGLFGGPAASGDESQATQATISQGTGLQRGGETADPAPRRSIAEPPPVFDGAPRFHSGDVAGRRPDGGIAGRRPDFSIARLQAHQIPVIMQRAEAIVTPERVRAPVAPSVTIEIENRGTPQREVSRAVRLDPRGLVVSIVTDDLRRGGPIRQTLARELGAGGMH